MPEFRHLGSKFSKNNSKFQSRTFKIGCRQNYIYRLESWYFFAQKPTFEHLGSNFEKQKLVENSRFSQFWNWLVLGHFAVFWGVLAGFGSFWLVPDFSKYAKCAVNIVLNETSFVLVIHAWIFHQFILSCGRCCFLDITYKVFANHMFEISPDHYNNNFDTILTNN